MSTICAIVVGLGLSAAAPAPPDVILPGGMHMPYVNLGTGSGQHGDVSSATKLWIEAGGVGIDTAYDYDDEKDIAKGIAAAGAKASDLFITSKIPCASYSKATADIKSNLADLGVGVVDLTLIHFPRCSLGQSVSETWRALEDAKAAGLTRAIGVSHFGESDFEALAKTQKEPPVLNQCQLSVGKHDDATIAYCQSHGIVYQSYSPLCGGANGSSCSMGGGSSVLEIAQVIDIAHAHKVTPAQVGLKWVAQQGFPIACASWEQDYMVEDLDLWSWGNLTASEMATLSAVTHP